jgi:hypothetical protein
MSLICASLLTHVHHPHQPIYSSPLSLSGYLLTFIIHTSLSIHVHHLHRLIYLCLSPISACLLIFITCASPATHTSSTAAYSLLLPITCTSLSTCVHHLHQSSYSTHSYLQSTYNLSMFIKRVFWVQLFSVFTKKFMSAHSVTGYSTGTDISCTGIRLSSYFNNTNFDTKH